MNHSSKKLTRFFRAAASVLPALALLPKAVVAEELDAFRYGGGAYYTNDSNLFRIDKATQRDLTHEQSITAYALLGFDKTWSRQRFFGDFTLGSVRYQERSDLDHETQNFNLGWVGNFPRDIAPSLTWTRSMNQANYADLLVPHRNIITRDSLNFNIDVPIISSWHVLAGASGQQARNSSDLDASQNTDTSGVNAGVRYQSSYGNRIDLLYLTSRTNYPDAERELAFNDAYRTQQMQMQVQWAFSGASVLSGWVGYVNQTNDRFTQRDFSGPTYRLTYDWNASGSTSLNAAIYRNSGAAGDNEFQYAITKGIRLAPLWRATDKISVSGSLEWFQRNYFGDLLPALNPGFARSDQTLSATVKASWQATRWLQTSAMYTGAKRDSNYLYRDYLDNIVTVTAEAAF